MPSICPQYDPEPDPFFDAAAFFCEGEDYYAAAGYLTEGDSYRKSTLGLDAHGAGALNRHLATRGLALVDDGAHWLIAAAEPPSKDAPAPTEPLREEPVPACPHCSKAAVPGRITCGSQSCLEALGRAELDRRRGRRGRR